MELRIYIKAILIDNRNARKKPLVHKTTLSAVIVYFQRQLIQIHSLK